LGPCCFKSLGSRPKFLGAGAPGGSKSRLSCFLECTLDPLYGLGIAGLDEGDPDTAGAFHPPCGPCWRLDQPRLVKRMVEEDLLRQLIQVRLMIGVETGIAALILVEAIHLRHAIPQPTANLGTMRATALDAAELAHTCW